MRRLMGMLKVLTNILICNYFFTKKALIVEHLLTLEGTFKERK